MRLTPVMQRYIVHWGEMGSRWGMNRSVAQIHALLYLAAEGLHADEIAETLGIARSNVSVGLKELLAWNLVQITCRLPVAEHGASSLRAASGARLIPPSWCCASALPN